MEADPVLANRYYVGFILHLYSEDQQETSFKKVCNNYYQVQNILGELMELGYVERVDTRRKGRWYHLTPKGRAVADELAKVNMALSEINGRRHRVPASVPLNTLPVLRGLDLRGSIDGSIRIPPAGLEGHPHQRGQVRFEVQGREEGVVPQAVFLNSILHLGNPSSNIGLLGGGRRGVDGAVGVVEDYGHRKEYVTAGGCWRRDACIHRSKGGGPMDRDGRNGPWPRLDLEPYRKLENDREIMEALITDRSSGGTLYWATDDYSRLGPGYGAEDRVQYMFLINAGKIIRPRILKTADEQRSRSKDMAEVFTPAWVVNRQNNLVDVQWTGCDNPFNRELGESWEPTDSVDLGENTWQSYVGSPRLEVCCGEAPYLSTRYDAVSGEQIPVAHRVGLLDRKLRVVGENCDSSKSWKEWANVAVKSVYGYDYQGDNVILARENLLLTVMEHHSHRFSCDLDRRTVLDIIEILSWNIWQMDGTSYVIPYSCRRGTGRTGSETGPGGECVACSTGKGRHRGTYCRIKDWSTGNIEEFAKPFSKPMRHTYVKGVPSLENYLA